MKNKIYFILIALAINASAQQSASDSAFASLNWLSGYWTSIEDNLVIEEIWLVPKDSLMPGLHRETNDNGKAFFEYLRIEQTADNLIYFASPAGKSATAFYLAEFSDAHIVFENMKHDFPQRITYRLAEKKQLLIRIEGSGKIVEWRWYRSEFKP